MVVGPTGEGDRRDPRRRLLQLLLHLQRALNDQEEAVRRQVLGTQALPGVKEQPRCPLQQDLVSCQIQPLPKLQVTHEVKIGLALGGCILGTELGPLEGVPSAAQDLAVGASGSVVVQGAVDDLVEKGVERF